MIRHRLIQFTIAFVVLAFIVTPSVSAQPFNRTFVSAQAGSDLNSCIPTAPCRSFGRALSQTASDGEVIVLDSGGYGVLVITQSVQIHAPLGVYAGITATTGDAITINNPALVVRLRGLSIKGAGGDYGIQAIAVGSLYVENTSITGFAQAGLLVSSGAKLFLRDSLIRRNNAGVILGSTGALIKATITSISLEENVVGLQAGNLTRVLVIDTVASNNPSAGFFIDSGTLALENCAATHSNFGVYANLATVRLSNCTVMYNNTGLHNASNSATIAPRGNNTVQENGMNTSGTITPYTGL